MNDSGMERTLKRLAVLLGVFLLAISIYLSYDGFDQGVTGGNSGYGQLAKVIGIVIAVSICVVQFIFGSRYSQLNMTLKIVGFCSYAYSIYTNYLGAQHLLQMSGFTAIATACFMDIVPEPMISWGLGDSMKGDVFGNIGKWFSGEQPKQKEERPEKSHDNHNGGNHGNNKQGNHQGSSRRSQLENERNKQVSQIPFGDRREGGGEIRRVNLNESENGNGRQRFE